MGIAILSLFSTYLFRLLRFSVPYMRRLRQCTWHTQLQGLANEPSDEHQPSSDLGNWAALPSATVLQQCNCSPATQHTDLLAVALTRHSSLDTSHRQ